MSFHQHFHWEDVTVVKWLLMAKYHKRRSIEKATTTTALFLRLLQLHPIHSFRHSQTSVKSAPKPPVARITGPSSVKSLPPTFARSSFTNGLAVWVAGRVAWPKHLALRVRLAGPKRTTELVSRAAFRLVGDATHGIALGQKLLHLGLGAGRSGETAAFRWDEGANHAMQHVTRSSLHTPT